MDEIIEQIMAWGREKGIDNPVSQFKKLSEETLEAHEALWVDYYSNSDATSMHLLEEIGDIGVVWLLLCQMLHIKPIDALSAAHEKNRKRTGKTIRGNFIKDSDFKELS